MRYQFLFEKGRLIGAQAVAVAHTADDQVETILLNLLRGAGLTGLKGMLYRTLPTPWSHEIPLVRPLLGTWRTEVLDYVLGRGYKPVFDASNLDVTYARNRLRHELIPMLEAYHPGIRHRLVANRGSLARGLPLYPGAGQFSLGDLRSEAQAPPGWFLRARFAWRSQKRSNAICSRWGLRPCDPAPAIWIFKPWRRRSALSHSRPTTGKLELSDGLMLSLRGERLILAAAGDDPLVDGLPRITVAGRLSVRASGRDIPGWRLGDPFSAHPELRESVGKDPGKF